MIDKKETLRINWVDRRGLPSLLPHWDDLVERSVEDNAYYAPHYAMPLIETVARNVDIKFLTVWSGDILVALLPITTNPVPFPGLVPAGQAWHTPFTFNCMPLIDRQRPVLAASGLIDGLAGFRCGEWVIPLMNVDGPVFQAITEILDERNMPWLMLNEFERASLTPKQSFESLLRDHLSSKRRRELARSRRRLEERGQLNLETHLCGAGLGKAVDTFLKLEASGWKGKRGTALACKSDTLEFALKAFNSKDKKASRVDVLLVDGIPIAAGIIVFAGKTGFTVKNAYDEAYSTFSAGLLLEVEVLKSFLTESWAERLDSATNGNHVIDGFWPDRMRVADVAFSCSSPAARLRLSTYAKSTSTRLRAKAELKRILKRA